MVDAGHLIRVKWAVINDCIPVKSSDGHFAFGAQRTQFTDGSIYRREFK